MNQHPRLEVIDGHGWRRDYPLAKPIIYVGSGSRNDIVLERARGEGVAPLHAQLILSTPGQPGPQGSACRLVNVGDSAIRLGEFGNQSLAPRSATDLPDGTMFKLGDFKLVYHDGEAPSSAERGRTVRSQHIGLSLSLPRTQLAVYETIQGIVTVRNLGEQGYAQFNLSLEGLDPGCYELEPGPILPPGAEKEALLRLHHRGAKPLAGDHHIIIRASAPQAYPADEARVSQVVQVAPYHHHELRIFAPGEELPAPRETEPEAAPEPAPEAEAVPTPSEGWWAPVPEAEPPGEEGTPAEASPVPLVMRQPASEPEAPPAEVEMAEEATPEPERLPPAAVVALAAEEGEEEPPPVPGSEARAPDTEAETIPAGEEVEMPGPVETHAPGPEEDAASLLEGEQAAPLPAEPAAETEPAGEPAAQPASPPPGTGWTEAVSDEGAWGDVPAAQERGGPDTEPGPPPETPPSEAGEPEALRVAPGPYPGGEAEAPPSPEPTADRGEAIHEVESKDDVAAAEEATQAPKPGAEVERAPEPEPAPDEEEAPAGEEGWGGIPAEEETPQVLKLKASPPPEPGPEETLAPDADAGPAESGPPPSEDWWLPTDKGQG